MTTPPFNARLKQAERAFRLTRSDLYERVEKDPAFQHENVTLYDFNILENIDRIIELLDGRAAARLDELPNKTMIDIGCSNGDLGFVFEDTGFEVALLDKSHISEAQQSSVRQNAPLVASVIAKHRGSEAVVFDENIEEGFDPPRLLEEFGRKRNQPAARFGLAVMVGVLYHLKNPYSVMEKLTELCDHLIVGTWVADRLPGRRGTIDDEQIVYLLKDRELAADPTNYWIFTPRSLRVLAERCGWEVLSTRRVRNPIGRRERVRGVLAGGGYSAPDEVRERCFMFLKNTQA